MMFLVATNAIGNQPPKYWQTEMPTACANFFFILD